MEESAYQALYTGVYVFVFIIAISATIYLFKTMTDYSELAYNYGKDVTSDNVIENVSDSSERLLSGSDLVTFVFNYSLKDKYESGDNDIKVSSITYFVSDNLGYKVGKSDCDYLDVIGSIDINKMYVLKLSTVDSDGNLSIIITEKT